MYSNSQKQSYFEIINSWFTYVRGKLDHPQYASEKQYLNYLHKACLKIIRHEEFPDIHSLIQEDLYSTIGRRRTDANLFNERLRQFCITPPPPREIDHLSSVSHPGSPEPLMPTEAPPPPPPGATTRQSLPASAQPSTAPYFQTPAASVPASLVNGSTMTLEQKREYYKPRRPAPMSPSENKLPPFPDRAALLRMLNVPFSPPAPLPSFEIERKLNDPRYFTPSCEKYGNQCSCFTCRRKKESRDRIIR